MKYEGVQKIEPFIAVIMLELGLSEARRGAQ
jgi:hypothetical protein